MAKNYLHEGWTITVPAPTGGVHSGDPILVGGFFGVANYDAEQTLPVEITLGSKLDFGANGLEVRKVDLES
jgi:predicted RecA/RadA family phage recombinase